MQTQQNSQVDYKSNQQATAPTDKLFSVSFFNNKHDNSAKQESCSWDALLKIFKNPLIRNEKDGRLISGTTFKENKRKKEQAIESSLLILDFDHIDKIELSFFHNMGIAFAAYTTFSHATDKKPCAYRVIIPLKNQIPADKYPLLYQWAFDITNGLIDPACKDISRMQYLPACPQERKKDFEFFSNIGAFLDWQSVIKPLESLDNPIAATSNVIPISTQQAKPKKATQAKERDFSAWVETAIENELNNVRLAVEDNRNNTLNKSAYALGQIIAADWTNANQSEIESLLFDAALSIGLNSNEARATIQSGIEGGKTKPREIPETNTDTDKPKKEKKKPVKNDNAQSISFDDPLDIDLFPHSTNEKPSSTKANFRVLFKEYGVSLRYNIIKKEEEFYQNNKKITGAESDNIACSILTNLCRVNKMPAADISTYSTDFAWENRYNPVIDWIESKEWDGVNRFNDLLETIETTADFSKDLKNLLLGRWFVSCVAAAYNENNQFWSKGVLVFQGDQSVGKTSWFKSLLPSDLSELIKDGLSLDLESKDSILKAVSHWIVELGELDATFKKSDIARLKAFISEKTDIVRRPYAKRESKYPRQTVFCASVNDQDFLKDSSGNVRFWVVPIKKLNSKHSLDMQQFWAQITTYFKQGKQWWLNKEEEALLENSNKQFIEENRFAAILHNKLDWNSPKTTRLTTHDALVACGMAIPTKSDRNEMAKLLKDWFGEEEKSNSKRFYYSHALIQY